MYFKQLDSLRFILVFLVLISHWLHFYPIVEDLRLGAIGVEFFFVISGFLISLILFKYKNKTESKETNKGKALKIFFIRRVLRIFPLYYLIVLLGAFIHKGEILDALPWNLSYLSNYYFIGTQKWTPTFSHFWSLSVEEHFYIFWPFIILLLPKRKFLITSLLLVIIALAYRHFVFVGKYDFFRVYVDTISCLDLFVVGGWLAYFYYYHKEEFKKAFSKTWVQTTGYLLFLTCLASTFFLKEYPNLNLVYVRFISAISFSLILGHVCTGLKGPIGKLLENKLLSHIGRLSYAMYLVHNFIPGILLPVKKLELSPFVEFFTYLMATILASEILYRLVEKPIRNLNKRFAL